MRAETLVLSLMESARKGTDPEAVALRLRDFVREQLNQERAEIATMVLEEDLDVDDNPAKANPHEPRRWMEAAFRGAIARMVRERIEE